MLDLERLRALHAVAAYGSVGAAADALRVTPSAISQQVAKLERQTRAKLLERHGRGVRLTDAAQLLVSHADDILARVEQAESDFEAHRGEVAGELAVAAFATATRGLLPGALRLLAERVPRLAVSVRESEPPESMRDVERGSIDVAVVQDWQSLPMAVPDGLRRATLLDDVADLVLPADHPLASREVVRLREVSNEPWISSPAGAVCYELLVHTVRSYDVEPRIVHTAAEYETQCALVAAGLGLAILPRLGRSALPPGLVVVPSRPVLVRSVYAVWRSQVARRPSIRATVEALREVAAHSGQG